MSKDSVQSLSDIARLANVSISTVSRALNNSPLINVETRERIQAIARDHNFRMNASARNLRTRSSRTSAFVAPTYFPEFFSAEDLFGMGLLSGIGRGLQQVGYDLLIVHNDPRDSAWVHDYLESGRADGFILIQSTLKPANLKLLVESGAPFILWGVPVENYQYCSVTGDNFSGGVLATGHLIQTGRKRIAFLGGPEDNRTVQTRLSGYEHALQNAGLLPDRNLIAFGDYSYASGVRCMQHLLECAPDLDAVFVTSDLMAIGVIEAVQSRGGRVPRDVAVVGYDDLPIAEFNNLPLTTIRQNLQLAGRLLAENLIQHIQTGVITNVTTPVELVIRKSA